MCGRFSLSEDIQVIAERFEVKPLTSDWKPRYNIAPGQGTLAIIKEEGERKLEYMTFGLIPHFAKEKNTGYSMINAKAETIAQKPSFKASFRNKRCLILADGFFEWEHTDAGKLPFRFTLKNHTLFAFAGIWDSWVSREGQVINSTAIITTNANTIVSKIHDRMPVILHHTDEAFWLDPHVNNPDILQPLLRPYPDEEMEVYRVSPLVNSWRNDTPACILPAKGYTSNIR